MEHRRERLEARTRRTGTAPAAGLALTIVWAQSATGQPVGLLLTQFPELSIGLIHKHHLGLRCATPNLPTYDSAPGVPEGAMRRSSS